MAANGNGMAAAAREVKMTIDFVFKIAAIGIIVAVIDQVLKNAGRNEMATMTTLAGLVIVLIMVVQQISRLFTTIKSVFGL
jgi:stage III sporulation protein AC